MPKFSDHPITRPWQPSLYECAVFLYALRAGTCAAVVFAALFGTATAAAEPSYQVISQTVQNIHPPIGGMQLTETVVQEGELPINRFVVSRIRRQHGKIKGAVLLLPSLGNGFDSYLIDENNDITRSFAGVLARQGFDVWGYSPRETFIQAGDCMGGLDCTPMLGWSIQTIVDDASYIRGLIEQAWPGKLPVVGGFSLGAQSAIAVVNQNPDQYAGLLAWEGSSSTDDLGIQAHNQVFCAAYTGLVGAGIPTEETLPFVKLLAFLAETGPNDPYSLPVGLPPGLTNHQAFVFILSQPNPIAPSARPGFITAAGDFLADEFFFADEDRLFAAIEVFNDVTANRVSQDLYCTRAGVETSYTDNLASFTKPLMVIKAGHGFGSIMDDLPGKVGSTSVTFIENEEFAHVDHLASPQHWQVLELPVFLWLQTKVF